MWLEAGIPRTHISTSIAYDRAWAIVKYNNAKKPKDVCMSDARWNAIVRFVQRVLAGEITEPT